MGTDRLVLRDESGREHQVAIGADGSVTLDRLTFTVKAGVDGSFHIVGQGSCVAWTATVDSTRWVFVEGQVYTFELGGTAGRRRSAAAHHGALMAPMPATVRKLLVGPGDPVRKGDVLIVLEAMKMELPVRANADGRVVQVTCREGDLVQPGTKLVDIE